MEETQDVGGVPFSVCRVEEELAWKAVSVGGGVCLVRVEGGRAVESSGGWGHWMEDQIQWLLYLEMHLIEKEQTCHNPIRSVCISTSTPSHALSPYMYMYTEPF